MKKLILLLLLVVMCNGAQDDQRTLTPGQIEKLKDQIRYCKQNGYEYVVYDYDIFGGGYLVECKVNIKNIKMEAEE